MTEKSTLQDLIKFFHHKRALRALQTLPIVFDNPKRYRIRAPAKLNIRLKVLDRRPDGYHELNSIMVPIDLFDSLEIEPVSEGIELTCDGYEVPTDESNLVYRAARSFLDRSGIPLGLSIKLSKKIPVAAGLGGGSSDAASTLLLLNEICSLPFTSRELHQMALGLGADVPFFIDCRPALARGIGEILEPLIKWPKSWYILITPPVQVSTGWVYSQLKLKLTTGEYDYILGALSQKKIAISHILENDLEEVTSAAFPIIKTIKSELVDAGAEGALMSGSGPSVFGVFPSRDHALAARQKMMSKDIGDIFLVTDWRRGKREAGSEGVPGRGHEPDR